MTPERYVRRAALAAALCLAPHVAARAQDSLPAAPRPVPLALLAMRLGTARAALPDTIPCAVNEAGEEWCDPRPYLRVRIRDSAVVAVSAAMNFQAPDSLSADTVWQRYTLPRAIRFYGTPDSTTTAAGRTTTWWNWDGRRGSRRGRVVWDATVASPPGSTLVSTTFMIACAPEIALQACTDPGTR